MKKLRMILPAFAIVSAVAAALASNATPKAFDPVNVSDESVANCEQIGRCTLGGSQTCASQVPVSHLYVADGTCNIEYTETATFAD